MTITKFKKYSMENKIYLTHLILPLKLPEHLVLFLVGENPVNCWFLGLLIVKVYGQVFQLLVLSSKGLRKQVFIVDTKHPKIFEAKNIHLGCLRSVLFLLLREWSLVLPQPVLVE